MTMTKNLPLKISFIAVVVILSVGVTLFFVQNKSLNTNIRDLKREEDNLKKHIKLLTDSLEFNNLIKDSLLTERKRLLTSTKILTKQLLITKNNLLYIRGKYKTITVDSSLIILKKKYEMDSINNIKH